MSNRSTTRAPRGLRPADPLGEPLPRREER